MNSVDRREAATEPEKAEESVERPAPGDKPGIGERVKEKLEQARLRWPFFDHVMRMIEHYGSVKGNVQAGAATYFGFLSFFPIMALSFFAVGYVSKIYPDAEQQLIDAIGQILPGMVTTDGADNTIALSDIQSAAGAVGLIGLFGVLYSGLGWLSGMREALLVVFEKDPGDQPNFVVGKARDLMTLATIGVTLVVSVAITGLITGLSDTVLSWIGLDATLSPLLRVFGVLVGLAANMLLFLAIFRLLANPSLPRRSLIEGALLGAVGFEVLKQLSTVLMSSTKSQPAFQSFGIALILVVWINYFSRVVMYAASWAHTDEEAVLARQAEEARVAEEAARTRPDLFKHDEYKPSGRPPQEQERYTEDAALQSEATDETDEKSGVLGRLRGLRKGNR